VIGQLASIALPQMLAVIHRGKLRQTGTAASRPAGTTFKYSNWLLGQLWKHGLHGLAP
jgi:hypothetical protein